MISTCRFLNKNLDNKLVAQKPFILKALTVTLAACTIIFGLSLHFTQTMPSILSYVCGTIGVLCILDIMLLLIRKKSITKVDTTKIAVPKNSLPLSISSTSLPQNNVVPPSSGVISTNASKKNVSTINVTEMRKACSSLLSSYRNKRPMSLIEEQTIMNRFNHKTINSILSFSPYPEIINQLIKENRFIDQTYSLKFGKFSMQGDPTPLLHAALSKPINYALIELLVPHSDLNAHCYFENREEWRHIYYLLLREPNTYEGENSVWASKPFLPPVLINHPKAPSLLNEVLCRAMNSYTTSHAIDVVKYIINLKICDFDMSVRFSNYSNEELSARQLVQQLESQVMFIGREQRMNMVNIVKKAMQGA